jgi:DNA-binding MarR family transcriptional regulator
MAKNSRVFDIADGLHSTAIHLLRRLRVQDMASGIGPAKLSALSVLVFSRRPLGLAELASAEQVKNPTMSRLVSAMEKEGLVHIAASKQDARAVEIRPTQKGERLLLSGKERRVNSLAKVLQELKESELVQLRKSIEVLRQVVRRL